VRASHRHQPLPCPMETSTIRAVSCTKGRSGAPNRQGNRAGNKKAKHPHTTSPRTTRTPPLTWLAALPSTLPSTVLAPSPYCTHPPRPNLTQPKNTRRLPLLAGDTTARPALSRGVQLPDAGAHHRGCHRSLIAGMVSQFPRVQGHTQQRGIHRFDSRVDAGSGLVPAKQSSATAALLDCGVVMHGCWGWRHLRDGGAVAGQLAGASSCRSSPACCAVVLSHRNPIGCSRQAGGVGG